MLGSELGAVKPTRPVVKGFGLQVEAQIGEATKYGLFLIIFAHFI